MTAVPINAKDQTVRLTIKEDKLNLPEAELERLIQIGEQERARAKEKLQE